MVKKKGKNEMTGEGKGEKGVREGIDLEGIGEDVRALRIVSPAYAGREGELTAVLQYVYQSILMGGCGHHAFAALLAEIAADEMRHLQILGSLIVRLGAPPLFTACPPYPVSYYSASCVNYAKTPRAILAADITAERAAIAEYDRMIACLENMPVAAVLSRIREEEGGHLARLRAAVKMFPSD